MNLTEFLLARTVDQCDNERKGPATAGTARGCGPTGLESDMAERTAPSCGCVTTGKIVRGMCAMHYDRWVHATPKSERGVAPRFDRAFDDFVDKTGECWIWTGPRNAGGYGYWSSGAERGLAHRIALTRANPPADPKLFACHRCDNPPCVNPRHLYWGTVRDNTDDVLARGGVWNKGQHVTHCAHGHEMSGPNLRVYSGRRFCRTCMNDRARLRMAEQVICIQCGVSTRRGNLARHKKVHHG